MTIIASLKRHYRTLSSQFGFNPGLSIRALRALPGFIKDFYKFSGAYKGRILLMPFLHDKSDQAGSTTSEYFIQDLNVAKRVFSRIPVKHVDVGSRIDGFVAHVASFRDIEVIDIRPIQQEIPGIAFKQSDLTDGSVVPSNYCDSVTCLHALEHFGLGRYGDKVDPSGWKLGLSNLARLLTRGGRLYLSVPIGRELVMFNAHRVFDPRGVVESAREYGLVLDHFSWIAGTKFNLSHDWNRDLESLGSSDYSLGIFEFLKE
jgi:hypothetical protein